jgi:hypothetical protein
MTDQPLLVDGKPVEEKPESPGVELDANGDPVRQGSLMDERQSYERVIEGLKMVSDACAHLIKHEPLQADYWRSFMTNFDQARRICVQHAGLGLVLKENETQAMRGDPLPWRKCRMRFLEGIEQAAGGCRQLATCHRSDIWWTTMAETLDALARKINAMRRAAVRQSLAPVPASLILPDGFTRH